MKGYRRSASNSLDYATAVVEEDDGDDEYHYYSMALEYKGHQLHDHTTIPKALPINIDQIPTANSASAHFLSLLYNHDLSLPVVQPVSHTRRTAPSFPIIQVVQPVSPPLKPKQGKFVDHPGCPTSSNELCCDIDDDHHDDYSNDYSTEPYGDVDVDAGEEVQLMVSGSFSFGGRPSASLDGSKTSSRADECLPMFAEDENESSDTPSLGFSDSPCDVSRDFSVSSDQGNVGEISTNCQQNQGFEDDHVDALYSSSSEPNLNPHHVPLATWRALEGELGNADVHNDDGFYDGGDDGGPGLLPHLGRSTMPFLHPDANWAVQGAESVYAEDQVIHPKLVMKKGLCHRCRKGNGLTEKETCISCEAKYCGRCVLRAMGSMPEGRKCLGCIGTPVAARRRRVLGKCSRMLRSLLSESQVTLIMSSEISCASNQLSLDQVWVNGGPLSLEEFTSLLNCPRPPKNLKPGSYWYDKGTGLWGKEGHKPCQVITPSLNIHHPLKRNASNGNTNITINNREITKVELLFLQWSGVPCAGLTSLWLSADGTFEEEGQKVTKGSIWGTKRARLICNILALPIPESSYLGGEKLSIEGVESRPPCRFLLVGNARSGASTIFKQARNVYNVPFSKEEREDIKFMIQRNLYGYLAVLLEGRELFEEEKLTEIRKRRADQPGPSSAAATCNDLEKTIYSIGPRLKTFSDWLIELMISGNLDIIVPASTHEYAQSVEELWKEQAIQATYSRRNELELPRVASYFLNRAVEISKANYEPSDTDILYADGVPFSDGVSKMDFSFHGTAWERFNIEPVEQEPPLKRYQLVRVPATNMGENCKWMEMFEDAGLVLFCVALTDYDEHEVDRVGVLVNRMLSSRKLFERVVSHPSFRDKNFLLILSKIDLLEEKIEKVPLNKCEWFHDFNPVVSRHRGSRSNPNNMPSLAHRAFHYVGVKFKQVFKELTGRKLYVWAVSSLEADAVDGALKYAREILAWEETSASFVNNELSSESIESYST